MAIAVAGRRGARGAPGRIRGAILLGGVALAGCGSSGSGGGATVPARVVGAWGVDCSDPFVTFGKGKVHVGPDKADYTLTGASMASNDLTVSYTAAAGPVTEHYLLDGDMLRLDRGTYAGQEATWHKAPMPRCR